MRGTLCRLCPDMPCNGFIPACAGNTLCFLQALPPFPVHPRVCGEHFRELNLRGEYPGSSPRVRGTHRPVILDDEFPRFIPACAGNTGKNAIAPITEPVHPRVCGEHKENDCRPEFVNGSSPRVRGTRNLVCCEHRTSRFIPACAGNTQTRGCQTGPIAVHPRVCGEHGMSARQRASMHGSSPRVRGTPGHRDLRQAYSRFIPACAGNTQSVRGRPSTKPVHPRVCGEHAETTEDLAGVGGSSPRVRGTRHHDVRRSAVSRFIPACAGNTSGFRGC